MNKCLSTTPLSHWVFLLWWFFCQFLFIYLFSVWGLNSGPSPWATPPTLFFWRVFEIGSLGIICPGWLQTEVFLISATWVVRIIGMSHQRLAFFSIWYLKRHVVLFLYLFYYLWRQMLFRFVFFLFFLKIFSLFWVTFFVMSLTLTHVSLLLLAESERDFTKLCCLHCLLAVGSFALECLHGYSGSTMAPFLSVVTVVNAGGYLSWLTGLHSLLKFSYNL
jgi:hypothetical protein